MWRDDINTTLKGFILPETKSQWDDAKILMYIFVSTKREATLKSVF